MTKKLAAVLAQQKDIDLARTFVNRAFYYDWLEKDPDAFRLGREHFEYTKKMLKLEAKEIFNRVSKDGRKAHKPLRESFVKISKLSAKERKDVTRIVRALRG